MAKVKKSKNIFLWVGGAALVALLGYAIYATSHKTTITDTKKEVFLPKAEEGKATQPSPDAIYPSPIPATSSPQSSKNGQIIISKPTQGSTITSGTTVSGSATTSSNKLFYRLKGSKSGQLALGSINFSGSSNTLTPFSFELGFTNQVANGSDQGVLEIFITGADGSEQSIANVTVNIKE